MTADIKKVAVIGAGVMGAGIAAHVANAGVSVVLLDIVVPRGADDCNAIADGALARMLKADPAPFMSKAAAKLVTTGNIEDHLGLLAECDWIVEAVVERLDVKQALYAKVEANRKPGSVVSSNTSTIPLGTLVAGLPETFARDFLITHFFNPPRYMRLLEVVTGERTRAEAAETVSRFCDYRLGKSVGRGKDLSDGHVRGGFHQGCTPVMESNDRELSHDQIHRTRRGQRQCAFLHDLGTAFGGVLHGHNDALGTGHQIHRTAHAGHHLARDHPVREVTLLIDLQPAEHGQIEMPTTNEAE